tara:strand:- start:13920 stop:14441 length:522 start_codon:yes stop_codon:yes gene_type:complete
MSLLSFFKSLSPSSDSKSSKIGILESEIKKSFPDLSEQETIKYTCISGLLCRVAFVDLDISKDEDTAIKNILEKELNLSSDIARQVTDLSIKQTKVLSGIENHRYTAPLCDYFSKDERYSLLKSLFCVAASDGNVDNLECEEIRTISKGLKLEPKHYSAARASVKDFLGSLNA